MTETQQQCVRYRIYGRVQGVGFRYSTWREARALGLTGYARNLDDGSVEVVACGTPEELEKLLSWLQAGGPRSARVDNLFSELIKGNSSGSSLLCTIKCISLVLADRQSLLLALPGLWGTGDKGSDCFLFLRRIYLPWLLPACG